MELTKYKNGRGVFYLDLYGNAYKHCCKCNKIKGCIEMCKSKKESFGFMGFCKKCQKEKDNVRLQNPIERIKAKERNLKCIRKKGIKPMHQWKIETSLSSKYKSAPKTNIMLVKCEITGKDFFIRKTKRPLLVHPKCGIKGDYSTPKQLAKVLVKHGRFHSCKHCDKSFDLIERGLIQSASNAEVKQYLPLCSVSCRTKYAKQSTTEANRRRRARERVGYIETIRPEEIYRRDKYKCWICNCKVVSTYGKDNCKNSNAATLDHIIPLVKGGTHSKNNIKTACRQCNSLKGDTIIEGTQINIFTYSSN